MKAQKNDSKWGARGGRNSMKSCPLTSSSYTNAMACVGTLQRCWPANGVCLLLFGHKDLMGLSNERLQNRWRNWTISSKEF